MGRGYRGWDAYAWRLGIYLLRRLRSVSLSAWLCHTPEWTKMSLVAAIGPSLARLMKQSLSPWLCHTPECAKRLVRAELPSLRRSMPESPNSDGFEYFSF